ncbi:MAG: hypothetical protein NC211_00705 [Alistipes senegalensis]|nr:hypothetical protein [Oxalobacter formigenes]MCM1280346.1 hypothetical protein [Alistipes senegalensis]
MSGDEMGAAFFAGDDGDKAQDADEALWIDGNGFAGEVQPGGGRERDGGRSVAALQEAFAESTRDDAGRQSQALKLSMGDAAGYAPEEEAKIRALARAFDAPPEMARRYREQFEAQARNERLEAISAAYPKTAEYLSDPGNARIAHDDVENMTALEAMFAQPEGFSIAGDFGARADKARLAPLDFTVDAARNLAAGAVGGAIKTAGAVASFLARSLPVLGTNPEQDLYYPAALSGDEQAFRYEEAERAGKELAASSGADALYRFGKKTEEAIAGEGMGEYGLAGRALLSGFRSLGNMVPAVAGSFATGSPVLPLVFAGVSEGGEAFMDDVLEGKSLAKAAAHGAANGAIEVATEFLPLSKLIKEAAAGTPFISLFLRNWARETPSEMAATAGQTLSDRIAGMQEGEDAGDVFLKWLEELPENELETAISVIPMSLGFSGMARVHQARDARALRKTVERFNRLAGESRLRSRSPEDYAAAASFFAISSGVTHAYVDAGKWTSYFEEKGIDPKEAAGLYGVLNYEEASALGVSLMIPFGQYQAGFSGSEHAAAFTADTKFDEKALTATEGERQKARSAPNTALLAGMLHELGDESKTAGALGTAVEQLTNEVADQLVQRFNREDARTQAIVLARAFVHPIFRDLKARAEEAGKTVLPEKLVEDIRQRFVDYGLLVDAHAQEGGNRQYGQPAQYEHLHPVARQYLELAQAEEGEMFRYPHSDKQDLGAIADESGLGFEISPPHKIDLNSEAAKAGATGRWDVVAPDGSKAWVYVYPGKKLAVDASRLHSGESQGSALVQAVANFAYNMGYQFEGDRAGLTRMGRVRAAELMLSSALRYGTTRHLSPAKNLLAPGENGEPALKWRDGDDLWNITQLIETTYKNVRDVLPGIERFRYNFERNQFEEKDGKGNWRERTPHEIFRSFPEYAAERAKQSGIGSTTVARAVLVQSLREQDVSEKQGQYVLLADASGNGLPQQPDQTTGRLPQVAGTFLSRLLYQSAFARKGVAEAAQTTAEGWQQYWQPVTQGFHWEYGQRKGLFDLPAVPVTRISGAEFGSGRKAIQAGAMAHLNAIRQSGEPLWNQDTGWVLTVSKIDWSKIAKNTKQTLESLQAVFAIEQLAENAVLAESHEDSEHNNPDVQAIHRMYAPVEIGGVLYRAKLTVKDYTGVKSGDKTNLHAIDTIEIERRSDAGSLSSASIGDNTGKITLPSERLELSISDLLSGATRNDGTAWDTSNAGEKYEREHTRAESQTAQAEEHSRRGYTASAQPSAAEQAEANRQYDEIAAKYKGTALWMKAPNGEATKLTERQWVQARTANFKKQFGDWEKAGIRERLEAQEPISVKQVYTKETARIKKSEAAKLLENNFSVKKAAGEIFVTRTGIRDSMAHSRNAAKLDVIPYLKEILERAEYLDTLNDFTGKEIRNHYFATRIAHDGQNKLVFLRTREIPGRKNQLYVHDVFVEEEIKAGPSQTRLNSETAQSLRSASLYKTILQEIYSTVNLSISSVVDKNGEPSVSCWQGRAEAHTRRGFTASANPGAAEQAEANRQYDAVIAQYRGTSQWMKAPNGQPTKLTERQWVQVRTPNFKKWLGFDWERESENQGLLQALRGNAGEFKGIKRKPGAADTRLFPALPQMADLVREAYTALSENDSGRTREIREGAGQALWRLAQLDPETGEPQVYYHGSKADISAFDLSHPNKKDRGWLGKGIYLTSELWVAEEYAHNKQGEAGQNIMPLFVRLRNPYIASFEEKQTLGIRSEEEARERTAELIRQGYDGIIAYEFREEDWVNTKEVVVFSPEQVKSAISNAGTFSESPQVLYQRQEASPVSDSRTGIEEVRQIAEELASEYGNAPELVVVEKPADLPFDAPEDAKGAYLDGRCFLVRRNITSAADARNVFGMR